jgi:hypothetical protein
MKNKRKAAAALVSMLRTARERKRAATGKCEGRKSHAEVNPNAVRAAHGSIARTAARASTDRYAR